MKNKTYWLVFLALFLVFILPVMLWGSTSVERLEHKIIAESQNKVATITHFEFGEYGLMVMGKDEAGDGKMYALVRLPGMKRYWITETRDYTADQDYGFAVKDLRYWVSLHLDHGTISNDNGWTRSGYLKDLLLRLLIAAGFASIGALIIDKKVRKRQGRK